MGKITPKISVIMSTFNEKKKILEQSIDSILNQSFKDFEYIIILDNLNNIKIEKLIKKYKKNDNRIVFLKNTKNIGLADSLNRGIDIAKGKYIARMDGDDISLKNRLKKQYKYLKNHNNVDFLFGWVMFIDDKGRKIRDFKPRKIKVQNITKHFFKENLLIHPVLMCKSKVLKKEKYDPNFRKSQDFELWLRTLNKYDYDILDEILMNYRIPNKEDNKKRIVKVKNWNYWTLKALNKNLKYFIKSIYFWRFYLKTLFYYFGMRIPINCLHLLMKMKDKIQDEKKIQ